MRTVQVVLLTGGRVKIGYEVGLKLLRAGATLVVTSRFPRDTAQRYTQPHDAASWQVCLVNTLNSYSGLTYCLL